VRAGLVIGASRQLAEQMADPWCVEPCGPQRSAAPQTSPRRTFVDISIEAPVAFEGVVPEAVGDAPPSGA
jgi:hypothetical protein